MMAWFFSELGLFVLGCCWGSFLHVCAVRIPKGESVVWPRSHCLVCMAPVRSYDAVPLLSWLLRRGRCRDCGVGIGWRYPVAEGVCGLLFVWLGGLFPFSIILLPYGVLVSLLFVGSVVDLDEQWIPDVCSVGAMICGLLFSGLLPMLHGEETAVGGLRASVWGAVVGAGLLWGVGGVGKLLLKRDAMGLGDVKLLGGIGAFLGWEAILFVVFCGAALGVLVSIPLLVLGKRSVAEAIPFGPYLSVGAVMWLAGGKWMWLFFWSG